MKRGLIWLFVLLFLSTMVAAVDPTDFEVRAVNKNPNPRYPSYVPGEVIVGFQATMTASARAALPTKYGLAAFRQSYRPGLFTVYKFDPATTDVKQLIADLENEPGVAYVEQAKYYFIEGDYGAQAVPFDRFYPWQWNMKKIGMEKAWDISTGKGVTVAVLDTGLFAGHPDFMDTNIVPGFDFGDMDPDTTPLPYPTGIFHGTHVSGTIAQSTWGPGNDYGCVGVAYDAAIMPVKIFSDMGGGAPDYVTANGLMFAADNGADVINMSIGGYGYSTTLHSGVQYAAAAGCVIVASAGNDNVPWDHYPSGYPEVISVAATDIEDQKASYSNYKDIDISAPGGDLWPGFPTFGSDPIPFIFQATYYDGGSYWFSWYSGTSMASPHVAGVAALILGKNPGLSRTEVKNILTSSALALGDEYYYGAGRVDAYAALMATPEAGTAAGWRKALGGKGFDEAWGVQQTTDGGYIVAGTSYSYTHGHPFYDEDFLVYKLDANGNKQWRKNYGSFDPDNATAIIQTSDGGYLVVGATESFINTPGTWGPSWWDVDLLAYKIDANGNKQWRKNYGGAFPDGVMYGGQFLVDAKQTPDGGYILCSSTLTYTYDGSPWNDMNILVYKVNAAGQKQWRKSYGGANEEMGIRIINTADGGYALCGASDTYTHGDQDGLIYKLNAAGQKQWRKNYGGSDDDFFTSIRQTADGGYVVSGMTESYSAMGDGDMLVYKLAANGSKEWRKNFGGSGEDFGIDIRQTADGGYLVCGITESYTNGPWDWDSGIVYKLAPNGSKQWRKLYGGLAGQEFLYSLDLTSDGGFVMAGGSLSYGSGYAEYYHYHDLYEFLYYLYYVFGYWGYYQYPHWDYADYGYYDVNHWTGGDFIVYKLDANGNWE